MVEGLACIAGVHAFLTWKVEALFATGDLVFLDDSARSAGNPSNREAAETSAAAAGIPEIGSVPFKEIDCLDADASDWSVVISHVSAGVLVFDANGDDRLDIYCCQNGRNWVRPTDTRGVLLKQPRRQHNGLYINLGNSPAGDPAYCQLSSLAARNDTYVEEELLVENYLYPRRSVRDSESRPARQSTVAVAADFNADGRPDILVGNGLPGMVWSHPRTQRVLDPFVMPIDRQVRHSRRPISAYGMHLVQYTPRQSLNDQRTSRRGIEFVGANSLFLNMGDKDGDGLPEWADATHDAGIGGMRNTYGLAVADIDLDGDLDVYVANVMDLDYWPGGSASWAGGANQLYINQLRETGRLAFIEKSSEFGVSGQFTDDNPQHPFYRIRQLPVVPRIYSLLFYRYETWKPDLLEIAGAPAEPAQISWATVFQDIDDDGYPDLWVANDLGPLQLYRNHGGGEFRVAAHAVDGHIGAWMSLAPADYDGDLHEDVFVGNFGGSLFGTGLIISDPYARFDPVLGQSAGLSTFLNGYFDPRHIFMDGRDVLRPLGHRVSHSSVLPPDTALPRNVRGNGGRALTFRQNRIDPYEFVWGATSLDVQNDGRSDLYFIGGAWGRGGGLFPLFGVNPGRLLVNHSTERGGLCRLVDATAAHHIFNIEELRYDRLTSDGVVYRPAPGMNWSKRDVVYSHDRSVWTQDSPLIREQVTNHDLTQTAENGRAAIAADLNGDGFDDLLVRNMGGYDSRRSNAAPLRIDTVNGAAALPPPDPNYPSFTNYEPGRTRVYINQYNTNHWIAVRLRDDTVGALNAAGIGAKIIVNNLYQRVVRAGSGSHVSNYLGDALFGLASGSTTSIVVHWPDAERTVSRCQVDNLHNGRVTIAKSRGVVDWSPRP